MPFPHLIENVLKFRSERKPPIKIFAKIVDDSERSGLRKGKQYFDIFVEERAGINPIGAQISCLKTLRFN
ncbi:hypothetical protein SBDP1_230029 [Syntrophobacter sp. SbD1]|nr:hypothetical protein SBDP1_230029 [Syntrophobacter sp. SbD1]